MPANGYAHSRVYAINDLGLTVGYAVEYRDETSSGNRAVMWASGSTEATALARLDANASGLGFAQADVVNDAGVVSGKTMAWNGTSQKGYRASRWSADGQEAIFLGDLSQSDDKYQTSVTDINTGGTMIGNSTTAENLGSRAVRWDEGTTSITELENLWARMDGYASSDAMALNDNNFVAGYSDKILEDGTRTSSRAARWDATGKVEELLLTHSWNLDQLCMRGSVRPSAGKDSSMKKRHRPEQIASQLHQVDVALAKA